MSDVFLYDNMDNPFLCVDALLLEHEKEHFDAIIVDFHRETSAELVCMAEFLNGRASLVYGTHTHVQTNDEHILSKGTGMLTDV